MKDEKRKTEETRPFYLPLRTRTRLPRPGTALSLCASMCGNGGQGSLSTKTKNFL